MIHKVRELLKANPFHPFSVVLADGRRFEIASPDMAWIPSPGRGGLHFWVPKENRVVSVNSMLVASVEWISADEPSEK